MLAYDFRAGLGRFLGGLEPAVGDLAALAVRAGGQLNHVGPFVDPAALGRTGGVAPLVHALAVLSRFSVHGVSFLRWCASFLRVAQRI